MVRRYMSAMVCPLQRHQVALHESAASFNPSDRLALSQLLCFRGKRRLWLKKLLNPNHTSTAMGATIPKPSVESLQHEKRDCFFCSTKSKTWKSLAFGDSQTPLCIECHFIRTAIEQSIATKVFTISVPGGDIRHWSVNGRHEVDRPRFSGSIDYPKDGLLTSIAFELFTLPGTFSPWLLVGSAHARRRKRL